MFALSSSSSSDSSDEEVYVMPLLHRDVRFKNENYIDHTVATYNETTFKEHFRLSRDICMDLSRRYESSGYFVENADGKFGQIKANHQMLIYLWFVSHQTASFRDVADRFDCSISTLFKIIEKITAFLSDMAQHVITWPTNEEKIEIEQYFATHGFPGAIGAIDGCHIKIDKPTDDPDSFINRKHFYSIQMQVVCDHKRIIRDIFIGYPGSVHDSRVFRISPLAQELPTKCGDHYFLLGDSGYPCTRFVMTPFKDRGNLTPQQRYYNVQLTKNRYIIEHCFGILKQKFRQLYHLKVRNMRRICHIIRACCVLHNIALDDYIEEENLVDNEPNNRENHNVNEEEVIADDRDGVARRNFIAEVLYQGRQ